jgi:DNA-binding MarR family transcriptional regulator
MIADDKRPPTLIALPSYLAGNVSRIGHQMLQEAVSAHDLRLVHFAMLGALADFGQLAQHELADCLDVNRSHLVGYVDEIEERGLVRRERDPGDRRRQNVSLTPTGREQFDELLELASRTQADFLHVLSAAEQETLTALLLRVLHSHDDPDPRIAPIDP